MDFQKEVLENGIRLITVPMPQVESVTVLVLMGAGSRYETAEVNGISHFLEHMMFKGTKRRPTALALAAEIDAVGGEFNAFTAKDNTGYYIKCADRHLTKSLDVLADMILNSKLEAGEIEREKGVIIEEINLYEDTPTKKISDVYEELLYGKSALGRPIAGEKNVIKSIKREQFISYINRFYRGENMVIVIAGGIDKIKNSKIKNKNDNEKFKIIKDLVSQYFCKVRYGKRGQWTKVKEEQTKPAVKIKYKKTDQCHLCLGFRAYPLIHPDRYALSLLATILGGNMSSRLFTEVRERRGLAYYIKTGTERYLDVGHLTTQAGVDVKRIEEAVKVIRNVKWQMANGKTKWQMLNMKKDLARAKEFIKGKLALELEDSQAVAMLFAGQELLEGRMRMPEEIIKEIDKVTAEDVVRVARDIFRPERMNLAIIGPVKKLEADRRGQ